MNIYKIVSKPTSYMKSHIGYALCKLDGEVMNIYPMLISAQYMNKTLANTKVFEVVLLNGRIMAVLEEKV